jgi:hypothetical protein
LTNSKIYAIIDLSKEREVVTMREFYVFDEYGECIAVLHDEERASNLADSVEGYYCTDEN